LFDKFIRKDYTQHLSAVTTVGVEGFGLRGIHEIRMRIGSFAVE